MMLSKNHSMQNKGFNVWIYSIILMYVKKSQEKGITNYYFKIEDKRTVTKTKKKKQSGE